MVSQMHRLSWNGILDQICHSEFFLPSTVPDRKSAAHAVAAGFFAGFIMLCVFAVISVSLFVRHESTLLSAGTSTATIVMILVVLIVPSIGGFWTAARGIAALKQLRRQPSIQQTPQ